MKKFNFKKIAAMAMAAMTTVSAMSISVFAAETEDRVLAEIDYKNGDIKYIYESDFVDGLYTDVNGDEVVTFGIGKESPITPIYSGSFNEDQPPIGIQSIGSSLDLSFSVPGVSKKYAPDGYYCETGKLEFDYQLSTAISSSTRHGVGRVDVNGTTYRVNLIDNAMHTIYAYNLSKSNCAVASVENTYSKASTISGSCKIKQLY